MTKNQPPPDDPDGESPRDRSEDVDDTQEDESSESSDAGTGHDSRSRLVTGEWISSLLQSMERFDGLSESGKRRGRTAFDFEISIGTGLRSLDEMGFRGPRSTHSSPTRRKARDSLGRRPKGSRESSRPRRTDEFPNDATGDQLATVRSHDDELLVSADVSGVDRENVAVGFDDGDLVVGVSGRELERVAVPWENRTAKASVRNGILTVRVTPASHD